MPGILVGMDQKEGHLCRDTETAVRTHLETWTFYVPLVPGTHLFGACHAGGAQENLEFSGR